MSVLLCGGLKERARPTQLAIAKRVLIVQVLTPRRLSRPLELLEEMPGARLVQELVFIQADLYGSFSGAITILANGTFCRPVHRLSLTLV